MSENNKKGINAARRMKHRRKGGQAAREDTFDRSTPETLASQVDAWLVRLEERNYSPRTLSMNRGALRQFLTWAEARDLSGPQTITKPHLESFQRHLWNHQKHNGQPLSVSTQRQRLGAIQRLFAHLCKTNHIPANPAADLDLPRKNHTQLPRGLSETEVKTLLQVPDVRDPLGVRDRAILELLYTSGIRRTELITLDLPDLDLTGATIHVRKGKGGKNRLVPVGKNALQWLQNYLQNTRPRLILDPAEQALFITGYGTRLSSGYLGNWMKKTLKAAKITRPGCCHLLRHSCATHMLENGADIRLIQQLLGNASLHTTSAYTQVAIAHLQEVHARTHPGNGK